MNKVIKIENFKCFSNETEIQMGKITACVGMNSVGKSSLIQSLLLTRQIYDAALLYDDTSVQEYILDLNGKYGLQLGDSQRIKSSEDKEDIYIKIDEFEFNLKSIDNQPMQLATKNDYTSNQLEQNRGVFSKNFCYLNAERLGPRTYQEIKTSKQIGCGIHGENTFYYLHQHQLDKVDAERMCPIDEGKIVNTVSKQVEYWMDYIIPGIELNVREHDDLGISQLGLRQQVFDTGFMSPYNFGFGISYVLPIVVSGLLSDTESIMIVENPEAHLHPAGQSRIGFFLATMANAGVQILIETHSEHVLNGIRIAALGLGMDCEDICINYFSVDYENARNIVERIGLNHRMDLLRWPDGFFDQEEIDLRTLRELRKNC